MTMLRALSIQQPWAWLIAHGHKDIENRTWPLSYRGRLVIHAGKAQAAQQLDDHEGICIRFPEIAKIIPPLREMEFGGIVGIANLVDCLTESRSPWFRGPFGFLLKEAQPVQFVPFPGRLQLFPVNASLVRTLKQEAS